MTPEQTSAAFNAFMATSPLPYHARWAVAFAAKRAADAAAQKGS